MQLNGHTGTVRRTHLRPSSSQPVAPQLHHPAPGTRHPRNLPPVGRTQPWSSTPHHSCSSFTAPLPPPRLFFIHSPPQLDEHPLPQAALSMCDRRALTLCCYYTLQIRCRPYRLFHKATVPCLCLPTELGPEKNIRILSITQPNDTVTSAHEKRWTRSRSPN